MRHVLSLLTLLVLSIAVRAECLEAPCTVSISWSETGEPDTEGYRIYEYTPIGATVVYDGQETSSEFIRSTPTSFGVVQYTAAGVESRVIPRAVFIPPPQPATVVFKVTINGEVQ